MIRHHTARATEPSRTVFGNGRPSTAAWRRALVAGAVSEALRSPGAPLDAETRAVMEPRFGHDLSGVRVHTDRFASALSHSLGARALTIGADMFFGAGDFAPRSSPGRSLLAHELTHVVQQRAAGSEGAPAVGEPGDRSEREAERVEQGRTRPEPGESPHAPDGALIQRRLVAFGRLPDVNALLGLLGPRAGLTLRLNVADNQVRIDAVSPAAPPSPALRAQLTTIINHATQHAEVIIGRDQPEVMVGAFPQPSDLTVTKVQQIDIDDILQIEAGAPGNGVGKAMHEIQENFTAHAAVPAAGTDLFHAAHETAIAAESAVTAQLVGPGRRVAEVTVPTGPGQERHIQDFENYYLVYRTSTGPAATQGVSVTSSARRPKVTISSRTIDSFATGSLGAPLAGAAVPPAGAAVVAAAVADVTADPTATVRVDGFADDNEFLGPITSAQRAERVRTSLVAAGVERGRIHAEGHGGTAFVVANDSAAHRALNRRVVITVTRPGP
ncbi:eCIS core domain-containing protein [Actinoplanes sp. CA-030573]|uniref:eCIS core domain-containing protein n=1 Tax=Actinoplanes sp. CA-030573 TaxID=3239898 RepID=UPI003D94BBFB